MVGTGLIGTSVGLALVEAGHDVELADTDTDALAAAVRRGAGRPAAPPPPGCGAAPAPDRADPHRYDVAVVATSPGSTGRAVAQWLAVSETVMDVAGVKSAARLEAQPARRWVPTHPMAGSHRGGPRGARADLFRGRAWAVCPAPDTPASALERVRAVLHACGAQEVLLTADEHDRAVALVSHLPQIVASALAARLAEDESASLRLAGPGLRDTTRVAGSPADLWADLLPRTADLVGPHLAALGHRLLELSRSLDDPEAVRRLVREGNAGVARLPGRHSALPDSAADEVVTVIEDTPGALAALTALARDAGVDLLDLRVEHAPAAHLGTAYLQVPAGRGGAVAEALERDGRRATVVTDQHGS